MATEIYLPRLGESIEEATISAYVKKVGDTLKRGDVIAELETAKAMMELESPVNGVLLALFPEVGETINRGTLVAIVGKAGEDWQSTIASQTKDEPPPEDQAKEPQPQSDVQPKKKLTPPRVNISPNAKRVAKANHVDLSELTKVYSGKRITADDVLNFVNEKMDSELGDLPTRFISLTETQRLTANRMKLSVTEIPQFSVAIEVNAQYLLERKEACEDLGFNCSITTLLIEAVSKSLRKHPRLNAYYQSDRIVQYEQINLSVAMAIADGLVAPVIDNADTLDLKTISKHLVDLKQKAELHKLAVNEVENGTFTISNLGMMGIRSFVPMVVPQQAGILGVGEMYPTLVFNEQNQPIQQTKMMLTLTADHRVVGGLECAEFLHTLKTIIEKP